MNDVSKIFPGFYIGSLPAVNRGNLDNHQITHILSILNEFRPKWTNIYNYLHIDIYDSPSVDIKKYFEKTYQFIEEGRRDGAVLVHCFAGISRSATICIAYCMRKLRISFEDAHGLLFDARPIIFPNDSFIKQLKKYESELKQGIIIPISSTLKFKLYSPKYDSDEDDSDGYDSEEEYDDEEDQDSDEEEEEEEEFDNVVKKDKKSIQTVTIQQTTTTLSNITISSTNDNDINNNDNNNDITNNNNNQQQQQEEEQEEEDNSNKSTLGVHRYCCRKCSTELFVDFDIMDHIQGEGQAAFKFHKRDLNLSEHKESAAAKKVICTSYFISEIEFVLNQTGEGMSGKLSCFKCKEKLGSWSWSGEQCSCGQWIAPSFQIPKTRVDEKKITQLQQNK